VPGLLAAWFKREGMKRFIEWQNDSLLFDTSANSIQLSFELHVALARYLWVVILTYGSGQVEGRAGKGRSDGGSGAGARQGGSGADMDSSRGRSGTGDGGGTRGRSNTGEHSEDECAKGEKDSGSDASANTGKSSAGKRGGRGT
jgi:hypothetical protein